MLVAKLKEVIKLQKIYWYYITNWRLIQWTRSNDHSETDDKALYYITYSQKVGFDTFWSTFKLSTFDTGDRRPPFFSLQPSQVHSMYIKSCDRPLQCLTALCDWEVRFIGFGSAPKTVDQSKQIRSWRFVCVFSVSLKSTPNLSSLAWFCSLKTFWQRSKSGIHVGLIKQKIVNREQVPST